MFDFTQSVVSLPVSHMDLDTGYILDTFFFLSGAVFLLNAALTEAQLAGWEAALCICNTVSDILNENSSQYVTLMSQSQMLDGFFLFFFWLHCPLHKKKAFQRTSTLLGPVLGLSHCIWTELTFCSKINSHGTLMSFFPPNHFQPSLVCSKVLAIFFKSLMLLLSACPLCY